MSKKTVPQLKEYFKAAKRPTEGQFGDLLDSYAHLDSEVIQYLSASEYTTYLQFPANYQVGDYIEFLAFQPDMSLSAGYYEISVAYTRAYIASAATHIAAVSHANPNIWRECGKINRNNFIANENTNCFTIDVNGALSKFRIRATKIEGAADGVMSMVIKVRSINKNLSWTELNIKGNDTSVIALQPMTDEWELLVGSAFSPETAKVGLKVKSNGNVGVGLKNPSQKLTVSAKQQLNQGFPTGGINSSAILRLQSNSEAYGEVIDFGMNVQPSYGWIQPQDLNSSSAFYNLSLNPKGGNVGIGITEPKAKLDVAGGINILYTAALQLSGEDINHGLKFKRFFQGGSELLDGPFMYGYSGGSLGSKQGNDEKHILNWKNNGNVGIGTNSPNSQFHVQFLESEPKSIQFVQFTNYVDKMNAAIRYTWYNEYCDVGIVRGGSTDISAYAIKFNGNEKARFAANGNAAFQGKVEAKDFVVSASPTADFVFAQDYNLRGINDLEKFISEKQHLPEIPSAKEMTENGVTVGEFQIKLLQKIEELTLYAIAQHKELEQLKSKINTTNA